MQETTSKYVCALNVKNGILIPPPPKVLFGFGRIEKLISEKSGPPWRRYCQGVSFFDGRVYVKLKFL